MPYALQYNKAKRRIYIESNGYNPGAVWKKVNEFIDFYVERKEAYKFDDYHYALKPDLFEEWYKQFNNYTTYSQTLDFIRGTDTRKFPEVRDEDSFEDKLKLEPYPYQKVGATFLHDIERGLIGDEMGLGKTLQTLFASMKLLYEGKVRKIMIVCPSSVKFQWQGEIEKFTEFKALVVNGAKTKRMKGYQEFEENPTMHFLIANYESIRTDIDTVKQLDIDVVIADEAHRMKNMKSKLWAAMMELQPQYRFAATGTPMQNSPLELYALVEWLNPDLFGSLAEFQREYVVYGEKFGRNMELGYKHLDKLRDQVSDIMLRRMKKDVLDDLPKMIKKNVYVDMDAKQKKLYTAIAKDQKMAEEELDEQREKMKRNEVKKEKMISEEILHGYRYLLTATSDSPQLLLNSESGLAKNYIKLATDAKVSAKEEALVEIIGEFLEDGSRVIIFTQFTSMIDLLLPRLEKEFHQTPYVIDGRVKDEQRNEIVKISQSENSRSDILIASDAANYGLNLTGFDVLIQYDLPWNPSVAEQRAGRIHRIGSTFDHVTVINMMTNETIDEAIYKTLEKKAAVGEAII
jgi:SNF2 family DNA or RNA helicase